MAKTSKAKLLLIFLAATLSLANSTRVLFGEEEDQPHVKPKQANPATTLMPSGQTEPLTDGATSDDDVARSDSVAITTNDDVAPHTSPITTSTTPTTYVETPGNNVTAPVASPTYDDIAPNTSPTTASATPTLDVETPRDVSVVPIDTPKDDDVAPNTSPIATSTTLPANVEAQGDDVAASTTTPTNNDMAPKPNPTTTSATPIALTATVAPPSAHGPTLSFFMHNIFGGSRPSARVVNGLIANPKVSPIPFSKPNNRIKTINNLINNPNTVPFLTGNTNNILMFGAITVIDDELTEGHELGAAVIGKAQGFYLVSSIDGTSHTIALTVILHGGERDSEIGDTISFFGVHRTAMVESHIAVVGGTGKSENAGGYATVVTIHYEDQHTTDGVDTILNFNVFLTQ